MRDPVPSQGKPSWLLKPRPARHHPGTSQEVWGCSEVPKSPGELAESGSHTVAWGHRDPSPQPLAPSSCRLCCPPGPALLFPAPTSWVVGVGGWSRRRLEGEKLLVNKLSTPLALIGFVEADTLST